MDNYKVSQSEKVLEAEKDLARDISELKNELEETEMLYGKNIQPLSSVANPMDPEYFRREREIIINNIIRFDGGQEVKNQGLVMVEELLAASRSDFSKSSLPLLLHQFFLDRMDALMHCKHLHMLRWRRFAEHAEAIEKLLPLYRARIEQIDREYADAKRRAHRLSVAHSSFVMKDTKSFNSVKAEDMAIFVVWTICHLHSIKKVLNFTKLVNWMPIIYRNKISSLMNVLAQHPGGDHQMEAPKPTHGDSTFRNLANSASEVSAMRVGSKASNLQAQPSALHVTSEIVLPGFVSDERSYSMPAHYLELASFREQLELMTTEYGIPLRTALVTSADEMELFGAVNRKFKILFNQQEECSTFYQYDNVPEENENWGVDSASHCLLKPSPWVKYITMTPRNDAQQLKQLTYLKQTGTYDELLLAQNKFLLVKDHTVVTDALKRHAVAVREPPTVQAVSVTSHVHGSLKSAKVWRSIYENSAKEMSDDGNSGEGGTEASQGYGNKQGQKKQDQYDYTNTMQMLGLDEGDDSSSQDQTVIQGAYLSFLHLRHLKIRDLRRQCLQILNYFRSIERTITIYDGGLSLQAEKDDTTTAKSNRATKDGKHTDVHNKKDEKSPPGAAAPKKRRHNIGSHHYVYNIPADFKIDQNQFMEFGGVENHDDFYTFDCGADDAAPPPADGADGAKPTDVKLKSTTAANSSITASASSSRPFGSDATPHVQDQRGYFVVYEAAADDFRRLERQLLLVASYYIEKDKAHRTVNRRSTVELNQRSMAAGGEVDIAAYGHRDVDRFGVLLDVWTCELNFLINKRKVLDCYVEAYHNTFEFKERQRIAQLMTNVMHQRPRYDFTADYFIPLYRSECACLRYKTNLISQILASHIDDNRQYLNRVLRPGHVTGMPFFSHHKQDIAVHLPQPAVKHVDMLEFHSNMAAVASRVAESLDLALHDLRKTHIPSNMTHLVLLERQVLELAQIEWNGQSQVGTSFSLQLHKDIFAESFIEDPILVRDAVQSLLDAGASANGDDAAETGDGGGEESAVGTWSRAIDCVMMRHRLVDAAWETEVLSRLYRQLAAEMGYDDYHMYLRLLQFEFATKKEKVDMHPSMMATHIVEEGTGDRYVAPSLLLAIQELDENHLPKFSFRSRDTVVKILQPDGILENVRIALCCQVVHKNALMTAVNQAVNCMLWKDTVVPPDHGPKEVASDTRSNMSVATTVTVATGRPGAVSPNNPHRAANIGQLGKNKYKFEKHKKCPEAFISIQREKQGPRDAVVNRYIQKAATAGMLMRKPGEIENLKRTLVTDFCNEFSFRTSNHAMRAQIIACYASLLRALEPFPSTYSNYFMAGDPNEKKKKTDDVSGMVPDPKTLHRRPRRVMSPDGKHFINLWFVPHYTEILASHRNLDYETQHDLLVRWLTIAASLHDIVHFLCARSRLGSMKVQNSEQVDYSIAADWGGAEGVGAELEEIQQQLEALPNNSGTFCKKPADVAELLLLRKQCMFLEFDAAVNDSVCETFLATDNSRAYDAIKRNAPHGMDKLIGGFGESLALIDLKVPETIRVNSPDAKQLFPWLSFQATNGAHPTGYFTHWQDIESCAQLCLAGLTDTERQACNGEILGVELLLDEVLQQGETAIDGTPDKMTKGFVKKNKLGKQDKPSRPSTAASSSAVAKKAEPSPENDNDDPDGGKAQASAKPQKPLVLSKIHTPILSYRVMKKFLKLFKQLNVMKFDWGSRKLLVESVVTGPLYRDFVRLFQTEVMLPVYVSIARQMGSVDEYADITADDSPIPPPNGASELAVRGKLLVQLLENLELHMIGELRQRISKDVTLVLAERARVENALPTDLWHHPSQDGGGLRENITVTRPHIVEDFVTRLMSAASSQNGTVSFQKEHLSLCLSGLGTAVMQRERDNYESYSSYYEHILQHHHHLLYQKELQLKAIGLRGILPAANGSNVEFQLADRSHELILEITALRAKVGEMREQIMSMEQSVRDVVRSDCQELIENLFECCFQMKAQLAQCHMSIHDDIRHLVSETREEAMKSLGKLKDQIATSTAEERLKTINVKEEQLNGMRRETFELNMLFNKMQALNHWKKSVASGKYKLTVEKLRHEVTKVRRDCLSKELVAKEEADVLREELGAARKSLQDSEANLRKTHDQIQMDKKIAKEKKHMELLAKRNRQQLQNAQHRKMERLLVELQEKDKRLRTVTGEVEKNAVISNAQQQKIHRNLKEMEQRLSQERNLKLDAFDRVDDLQAAIMHSDHNMQTALSGKSRPSTRPTSAVSGTARSMVTTSTKTNKSRDKAQRPFTSMGHYRRNQATPTALPKQRPSTAGNPLKSKIAAALLADIQPTLYDKATTIEISKVDI